jgi:hypothetical protein
MPWNSRSQDPAITGSAAPSPESSAAIARPSGASALAPAGGTSRRFLLLLALITCVPLIALPLASELSLLGSFGGGLVPVVLLVALITGPVHVACTAFFYFDPEFRPVLGESPARCLWSPALVPLAVTTFGVVGAMWVGPWAFLLVFAYHTTWLFYHYQRQNFGLISFISKHFGSGRLPPRVNSALNLAALGGILCLFGSPDFWLISGSEEPLMDMGGLVGAGASTLLRGAGTIIYALAVLLMIGVLSLEKRLRSNAWVIGALFLSLAFFLPPVLFTSLFAAFLPLAIAHGAQYLLMMGVVSGRSNRSWLGLGLIFAACVGAGVTLNAMPAWPWPAALIGIGLVQVHFLVDAKVWRLREPRQREIMNERFDFFLPS